MGVDNSRRFVQRRVREGPLQEATRRVRSDPRLRIRGARWTSRSSSRRGAVVVIGRKGNAGSVWVTNRPSWPIDTTYFLRPPQGLLPDFFALQLGHLDLVGLDSSTTIPSLRRPDLEATSVAIAPVREQRQIVAVIENYFSRLDAAERALADAKRKLVSLQRSAIAQLFNRADWPWTTLGEIATLKGGVTKDSKRQNDPSYIEVQYLRVANVQRGYLDLSESHDHSCQRLTKAAQLTLRPRRHSVQRRGRP